MIGEVRTAHASGDVARMADLARRIAAVLAPHTEVEESGLFLLPADEFPDHVTTLQAEHRRVETVLAAASMRTPDDPDWPHQLIETLDLLREHILKNRTVSSRPR